MPLKSENNGIFRTISVTIKLWWKKSEDKTHGKYEPRADIVYERNKKPIPFREKELLLQAAVKSVKNNKSPVSDCIPSEILKIVAENESRTKNVLLS